MHPWRKNVITDTMDIGQVDHEEIIGRVDHMTTVMADSVEVGEIERGGAMVGGGGQWQESFVGGECVVGGPISPCRIVLVANVMGSKSRFPLVMS